MFEVLEGIDIEPAAAVAVACLDQAVRRGDVPGDSTVLLNVTGGGRQRAARDHPARQVLPTLTLGVRDLYPDRVGELAVS
jgi:cysteate synthase